MIDTTKALPIFLVAIALSQFSFGLRKWDLADNPSHKVCQQIDPKVTIIKQNIEDENPIIIKKKADYYILEHAFYDEMYDAIMGNLKNIEASALPSSCLIVACSQSEHHLGLDYIYINTISSVQAFVRK